MRRIEPLLYRWFVSRPCWNTSVRKSLWVVLCCLSVFGCVSPEEKKNAVTATAIPVSDADVQRMVARFVEKQNQPSFCESDSAVRLNRQGQVKGVYLVASGANETNLLMTCAIPTLEHLELMRTDGLTETSFRHLRNARQLKVLTLGDACPMITAAIIRDISTLQNLQRLRIFGSEIEAGALRSLSEMPSLELVDLSGCGQEPVPSCAVPVSKDSTTEKSAPRPLPVAELDDRDFAALIQCKHLREMRIQLIRLSDSAIRAAAKSPSLQRLHLVGDGFSQEAVEWLRSHSRIKVVTHSLEEHWWDGFEFWSDPEEYVPADVVKQIPSRLKLLKRGMTLEDAKAMLGLTPYRIRVGGMGPGKQYDYTFWLRPGCKLTLTCDVTQKPPAFISGHLDDDTQ